MSHEANENDVLFGITVHTLSCEGWKGHWEISEGYKSI